MDAVPLALTFFTTAAFLLFHLGAHDAYKWLSHPAVPVLLQSAPDRVGLADPSNVRSGRETSVRRQGPISIGVREETLPGRGVRRVLVAEPNPKNLTFTGAPKSRATESSPSVPTRKTSRRNAAKLFRAGSPSARQPNPIGLPRETIRAAFIRFDGPSDWSIDEFAKVEEFYERTFGRPPPVSAMGQSETHDRLGLDHRDAVDIAVRPDTEEGRTLMVYLRTAGIPFIAFRGRFHGMSTGAHIHIGRPSPRLLEVHQRVHPIEHEEPVRG